MKHNYLCSGNKAQSLTLWSLLSKKVTIMIWESKSKITKKSLRAIKSFQMTSKCNTICHKNYRTIAKINPAIYKLSPKIHPLQRTNRLNSLLWTKLNCHRLSPQHKLLLMMISQTYIIKMVSWNLNLSRVDKGLTLTIWAPTSLTTAPWTLPWWSSLPMLLISKCNKMWNR